MIDKIVGWLVVWNARRHKAAALSRVNRAVTRRSKYDMQPAPRTPELLQLIARAPLGDGQRAWNQGYKMQKAGFPAHACPYFSAPGCEKEAHMHRQWNEGFQCAKGNSKW